VAYNPKLPPSANDSEVTSRVSGASLSDVDYKMKARQPIDAKEMRRQAHKSMANASANVHTDINMRALRKFLPQPIRPGAASAMKQNQSDHQMETSDQRMRNLATGSPEEFFDLIRYKLVTWMELPPERRYERFRHSNDAASSKHLLQETVVEVACQLAQRNGVIADREDSESILEDHIGSLSDWRTGKTPGDSGRQSPSVNNRMIRGFAASGSSKRMGSNNKNFMTLPSSSSSRSQHHQPHLYQHNVRDWVNAGTSAGCKSLTAAAAGNRSKCHSIKSNSSSRSKSNSLRSAAMPSSPGTSNHSNNVATSSSSAPSSIINVTVTFHFQKDDASSASGSRTHVEKYKFLFTEGNEMSLRTFKNYLDTLPTSDLVKSPDAAFRFFFGSMDETGIVTHAQIVDDSHILPFISDKQIEARVYVSLVTRS
jgi:hypothetical protein